MKARRIVKILIWVLVIDIVAGLIIYLAYDHYREHRYDSLILSVANKYGVDPCLVKAVIWRETHFRQHAVGKAGEIGLMQVLPTTAGDWARAMGRANFARHELFDPRVNIEAGAWYLRRGWDYWMSRVDDPLPFAIAEYNAGRGNVSKWLQPGHERDSGAFIEAIGFPTTKRYVRDVLERYEHYKRRDGFAP